MLTKKLGPYQITEEIGAGGMATVYRAHQASMDRHVAIKVIRSNNLEDPLTRERFRREARLIARLEHPHLLPVYDFDGDSNPPYIVMRYLEGGTLRQVLAQGELPHPEVIYLLRQVATALDYAHRKGVVHRDLKPSNVMIDREGNAFVTDFGIARASGPDQQLTAAGDLMGTPAYMSPEQARGDTDVDAAADIYALGAMVFEILTGSPLYEHESGLGVLMAHLNEAIPSALQRRPNLPPAVDEVLRKAVAKDRKQRYPTAEAFVNDLAKALESKEANAPTQLQALTQTLSIEQLRAFEKGRQGAEKKKETPSPSTPSEQQRQMTALFVDVTELAGAQYEQGKDTEWVRARMERLWTRFDEVVREDGGVIQSRTEDVGLALWGRTRINEDDPERAIRAALRMRELTLQEARMAFGPLWEATEDNPLPFTAGITTGPVLLERAAETGSYTASGATITLAGRVKDAAPPGSILVAHDTFAQVLGVFSAHPQEPLRIRGRKEPIDVYVVTGVKPRAFRLKARGIEGVEIKMIGREIELRLLQEALTLTIEERETQVVTVVGEAGVGKSRLLFEFSNWSELLDQTFWAFQARATQPSMLQPYSLTRDLFSFRFQILDSDPLDVVHAKFVKGVGGFLGVEDAVKAELIGHLVGFDFSHLPAVAEALKDTAGFRRRALEHLGEFFSAASRVNPVVIHLEDVHWADDRSLDLINNLVRENEKLPMFVLCMARPSLYDRRPQWGEGQHFHERIQLEPLSQLSSRRLVRELLKLVPEVPVALRDLVVERADGNPFYIEELIKALIDDGVIVKGTGEWSVDQNRLSAVRIPPTLTGVLQSRLDGLPLALQQLLQRVSVIGRIFWADAAIFLSREAGLGEDDVQAMLEDLRQREMILRREESGFAGTVEFIFRHAILRDVTYETLVPRQRRALHRQVGDWLIEMGGERAGEQTLLVAEHYERAGEIALAAEQLRRAGEAAIRVGAYDEARVTLDHALALVGAPEHSAARFAVMLTSVELDTHQGRYVKVREVLEKILPEIRASGDRHILGRALGHLGRIAMWQDDPGAARYLGEALELTRESGDKLALSFVLRQLGNVTMDDPTTSRTYLEESLALAQQLGNRGVEAQALNSLGNLHLSNLDQVRAEEYYRRCMALSRETKESFAGLIAESNLGAAQILGGDYEKARRTLEHVLQRVQELGDRSLEPSVFETLGWLELHLKNHDAARKWLEQSLAGMREQAAKPLTVIILFAVLEARSGRKIDALEWVACVRAQTTLSRSIFEIYIHDHLEEMTAGLSPGEVEAAFARGAAMSLDDVLRRIESGA